MNSVQLFGRLTDDPEVRETSNGKEIATFGIAVRRNKDVTDFFRVTCWERVAGVAANHLRKGHRVALQGSLVQNKWQDKDGNNRSTVEVNANSVFLVETKADAASTGPGFAPEFESMVDRSDNIPF